MQRQLVIVVVLAACDNTFGLVKVGARADAGSDIDADRSCWHPSYTDDEDRDTRIDGCDPCPADPASTIYDVDGDGIEDACDPFPSSSGDAIVDFDGFATQRPWQAQSGTWSFGTSSLIAAPIGSGDAATELTTLAADRPVVDVIFDSPAGAGAYMKIGPSTIVRCIHEPQGSPNPDVLILTINGAGPAPVKFDVGNGPGRMRVGIDLSGNAFCHAERGGFTADVSQTAALGGITTTRIGLIGRLQGATFSSVTLFARP